MVWPTFGSRTAKEQIRTSKEREGRKEGQGMGAKGGEMTYF